MKMVKSWPTRSAVLAARCSADTIPSSHITSVEIKSLSSRSNLPTTNRFPCPAISASQASGRAAFAAWEIPVKSVLPNRQRKDLLIRGTSIKIALPCPPGVVPLEYARSVLDVEPELIVAAEEVEIDHAIPIKVKGDGLTRILGDIDPTEGPTITSIVIVATLEYGKVRHRSPVVQWPAELIVPEKGR